MPSLLAVQGSQGDWERQGGYAVHAQLATRHAPGAIHFMGDSAGGALALALAAQHLPGLLVVQRACYGEALIEDLDVFARRLASPANCSLVLEVDGEVGAYLAAYHSLRGNVTPLHGDFEPLAAPLTADPLYVHDMAVLPPLAGWAWRTRCTHRLSILANAATQESGPLALLVQEQVATARRQVDYHLARARAAAAVRATGLCTPVLPPLRALLRTMQRLPAQRDLSFELAPQARDVAFRGEEQDLYELLGNLIDNAGKSARQRVVVDVQLSQGQLCITVDDDGLGIPEAEREHMFERGVQLDEQRPGSGLGLDIVRALAETYGGSVQAQASPLGGARLRLYLPAAGGA